MSRALPEDVMAAHLVPFFDRITMISFAQSSVTNAIAARLSSEELDSQIATSLHAKQWSKASELMKRAPAALGSWYIDAAKDVVVTPGNREAIFALLSNPIDWRKSRMRLGVHHSLVRKLADAGQTQCMYFVGMRAGDRAMLRRASRNGHADASLLLWTKEHRIEYLHRADEQKHPRAPYHLSRHDPANAAAHLQTGVGRGDAWAMFDLGRRYAIGLGVPQSHERSRELFEQGIRTDPSVPFAANTFVDYAAHDPSEGVRRLQYGHTHGSGACTAGLAACFRDGRHVPKDAIMAVRLLEEAVARAGKDMGEGVDKDASEDESGCFDTLAEMYVRGDGVAVNIERALDLSMRAACGPPIIMRILIQHRQSVINYFTAQPHGMAQLCDICVRATLCPVVTLGETMAAGHFLELSSRYDDAYEAFYRAARSHRDDPRGVVEMARMASLGVVDSPLVDALLLDDGEA